MGERARINVGTNPFFITLTLVATLEFATSKQLVAPSRHYKRRRGHYKRRRGHYDRRRGHYDILKSNAASKHLVTITVAACITTIEVRPARNMAAQARLGRWPLAARLQILASLQPPHPTSRACRAVH
eukprot:scaffold9139_cov64-Phaeocystis_antarctica.AAC.17